MHFIVSGHAYFASGLVSAAQLICGDKECFHVIDFEEGMTSKALSAKIREKTAEGPPEHTIIFTDLLGGAPFREASLLASEYPGIQVVAGTNLQLLIEAALEQDDYDNAKALLDALIPKAREGVDTLAASLAASEHKKQNVSDNEAEGI